MRRLLPILILTVVCLRAQDDAAAYGCLAILTVGQTSCPHTACAGPPGPALPRLLTAAACAYNKRQPWNNTSRYSASCTSFSVPWEYCSHWACCCSSAA